jgi:uncharacterized membrane protein
MPGFLPLTFDEPAWLWALLTVPVLVAVSWRVLVALAPWQRILALAVRSTVLTLIILCLAGVNYVRTNDDLTVIFLLDRSNSIPKVKHDQQEAFIRDVADLAPEKDRVGVVTFDGQSYVEQLPIRGGVFVEAFPETVMPDRTDLTGAVRMAMALFPHDTAKRIVVLSDGNNNVGDVLDEVAAAQAGDVAVDVVPIRYRHSEEVYIEKMIAPPSVKEGDLVPLRAVIHSRGHVTGTIQLEANGKPVPLPDDVKRQQLQPGSNLIGIKVPVSGGAVHEFDLTFWPDRESADTLVENNRATAYSFSGGKQRVLLLSSNVDDDAVLAHALKDERIEIDVLDIQDAGELRLAWLRTYSAVIISNISADWFTDSQLDEIASYVRDVGGGLIMTGGDQAFGAGGWIGTPIEPIMPVDFEIKHRQVVPRGALVVVMHSCEMPRANYWGKLVAKKAVDTISSKDYFGMLEYNHLRGVAWAVPLQVAVNKAGIRQAIDKMNNGDMPDFDSTLKLAVDGLMERADAAQRHIIIISDGDATPPSQALLQRMVDNKITCSTVTIGYGQHVMEQNMKMVANTTKGRFYPARNPKKLPQIFVKESKVVRRPLIVEKGFTPQVYYSMSELWAGFTDDVGIPNLGGLVMTSPKEDALVEMPLIRKTGDGDDPVLAHWHVGLGRTVAFTSGYWRRWGQDWTEWDRFGKLWAQIVRWTMGKGVSGDFDVSTRVDGGVGRIVVNALDKESNYLNMLDLSARVIGPGGGQPQIIKLMQVGPGRYEARYDVKATGQYVVTVERREAGEQVGTAVGHGGLSVPYSPEYKELRANEPLLQEIIDRSGGALLEMDDVDDKVFRRDGLQPSESRRPVWEWIVKWLLLPFFLLDVAVRRLASMLALSFFVEVILDIVLLFGWLAVHTQAMGMALVSIIGVVILGEIIGWTIRFRSIRPAVEYLTSTVTTLSGTGQSSASSLEQLRETRDRVREEHTAEGPTALEPLKGPQTAVAEKRKRFDVGEDHAAEAAGDLRSTLGGQTAKPKQKPKSQQAETESDGDAATMSRLLEARRRIKEELDQDESNDS